jgi:hypothetical protein
MALLGTGTAVLLASGLEACFGLGGYIRIMVLGSLAGVGGGIAIWYGSAFTGASRRLALAGTVPALLVLGILFVARILPLIQEELRYSR